LLPHVPLGNSLPDILAEKAQGPYRRSEFVRFQRDVLGTPTTTRPQVLEDKWGELGQLIADVLRLDPEGC
jgi:hypothetical protein